MKKRKLTTEDKRIIQMKADGFTDKEIAYNLNVALATYRYRYNRLLLKLDALNAPNLVYVACQKKIL